MCSSIQTCGILVLIKIIITIPSDEVVKCNVDVAFFNEQGWHEVDMCLRGEFIGANTTWFKGIPQSNEVEARDLKEAINWFDNLRFSSCLSNLIVSKWLTASLAI